MHEKQHNGTVTATQVLLLITKLHVHELAIFQFYLVVQPCSIQFSYRSVDPLVWRQLVVASLPFIAIASQLFGQSLIRRLPNCRTFLTTVFTVSCYVIKRIIGFCCVYSLQSESCLHFISQPYAWAPCTMQIDTIQQLASYNLASQVMATTHEVHRFRFLADLNENLKLTHKKTWC